MPWAATPEAIRELVGLGARVLAETPPAPDLAGLRALWDDVGDSGARPGRRAVPADARPRGAAGGRAEGVIGEPTSVQVCSTHLYHAVSMIRGLLGVGFEPAVVSARAFTAPLADPLTPDGWTGDGTPHDATTTIATLDFGGRMGLYDFTDNQWWNPLRTRRIVVRGSIGELVDDHVVRLSIPRRRSSPSSCAAGRHRPQPGGVRPRAHQLRRAGGLPQPVSGGAAVRGRHRRRDAARDHRRLGAGEGPAPYPLAEGLQDHLISLAIGESLATGRDVTTTTEDWAEAAGR